jgi:hypothetical protein
MFYFSSKHSFFFFLFTIFMVLPVVYCNPAPNKDQSPSKKTYKTPREWIDKRKPKTNPNYPAADVLYDFAYSVRSHSPKRERVATEDLPRYDLSRQKAHTYGRLHDILTKKFDRAPINEEIQERVAKSPKTLKSEADHYTRKADALSSRSQ